jgi:ATP-binding cassette subfamily F protein 3
VLLGANGSGKTTLLRALLEEHPLEAGRVGLSPSAKPGYLPQNEPDEPRAGRTPVEVIRNLMAISETEARRFLHRFLFSGDGALTPVERLSYGERRRLSLARLVLGGANILILDEPTNHLDIPSREAFEQALDSYDGALLAVTHDRYFIERFAQRVLVLEDGRLREV